MRTDRQCLPVGLTGNMLDEAFEQNLDDIRGVGGRKLGRRVHLLQQIRHQ